MQHYKLWISALLVCGSVSVASAGPSLCNGAPNGIIDGSEQCESGPCCTAKCELASPSTVCRASTDPVCDPAETCGTQVPAATAACPVDASAANGTSCSDGQFCTEGDSCTDGACTGGAPTTCDDDNDCTTDTCNENNNTCKHVTSANGSACDDGSLCTTGDVCTGGLCTGSSKICQDDNACTTDSCDAETGNCVFANNSAPCDDGLFCTDGDVCSGGACTGGPINGCDDGEGCTTDLCNEETDSCTHETAPDGTDCEDGAFCTTGETCTAGVCQGGAERTCNDDNDCTKDVCNENANECSHAATNNNGPCFDGSLCTTDDVCHNGVCDGGPQKVCNDGNPCTDDQCSMETGGCVFTNNTAPCTDGLFCTSGDTCLNGSCSAGPAPCDDGNPCTTDECDEALDTCVNENNANACDDGLFCTEGDTCSGGVCTPGSARSCADGNLCTSDNCNEASDACENLDNTLACDDGLACTTGDVCAGGTCSGVAKSCGDGNPCTTDSCDAQSGECQNVNNTASCEDGTFCTAGDTCADGACVPGPAKSCDDGKVCTTDSCNEGTDTCDHVDNTLECDDGLSCTVGDVCSGGLCSGSPRDCADENPCTADACNEISDECDHLDNSAPCNDGIFCNGADTCAGGSCSLHAGDPCDGPDADDNCKETCDEDADACTANDVDASPCSDGNACTVGDACDDGVCVSGELDDQCGPTTTVVEPTSTTLETATTTTTLVVPTTTGEPATSTTLAPATTTTLEATTTTVVAPTTTVEATTTTLHTVTTTTEECPVCGNYEDDDCLLTATDALRVLQAAVNLIECSFEVCDFNGDGKITAIDALGVLRSAVGLPATPNCPETAASAAPLGVAASS